MTGPLDVTYGGPLDINFPPDGLIGGSGSVADGSITTAKLTDGAVTTAKINDAAVTTAKVNDAAVTTPKLADNSVSSVKIIDGAIINADVNAAAAIDYAKLAGIPAQYVLQAAGASFSPTDATTYFFGGLPSVVPTTSAAIERLYIPKAGTIKAAYIFFNQSTGSNEISTMSIRLNNTTDYTISSAVTNDASSTSFNNTSLNGGSGIPVVAGDYVEIKWVCPTWATNPTGVRPTVILFVE